jgi:nucleotide-binding universal stress UspA family protein
MGEYKNIIFGTDYSENSARAFEEAKYLSRLTGGKLWIVTVSRAMAAAGEAPTPEETDTSGLVERYPAEGAEYRILYGHEAAEMIRFADSMPGSVIVIGARGIGVLTGLFGGGSVCDKVVANANCPVLVVSAS